MQPFDEVIFRFDDEPDAEYKASFIHYKDSFWIVATWLKPHAGGEQIPERIIPMAQFDPQWLGPVIPTYRLVKPIPRSAFDEQDDQKLPANLKAEIFPSIAHTQGPSSTH